MNAKTQLFSKAIGLVPKSAQRGAFYLLQADHVATPDNIADPLKIPLTIDTTRSENIVGPHCKAAGPARSGQRLASNSLSTLSRQRPVTEQQKINADYTGCCSDDLQPGHFVRLDSFQLVARPAVKVNSTPDQRVLFRALLAWWCVTPGILVCGKIEP